MQEPNRVSRQLAALMEGLTPDERKDFERGVLKLNGIRGLGTNLGAEIVAKVYLKVQDIIAAEEK